MTNPEQLLHASLDQLKVGYVETEDGFTCLCCGQQIEKGIIYPVDGRLYEAKRFTLLHIEREHQSVFAHLVQLDKRMTGLSELQQRLLTLFYLGRSDAEIKAELGAGSTSTIRNHRFILREKERQAKLFLAIMELLRERQPPVDGDAVTNGHQGRRRRGTTSDHDKVMKKYFPFGAEGPLQHFSAATPAKHKQIIVAEVAERFQSGRRYSEPEVNQVLEPIAEDYVLLRRCLVDYGFLSRVADGSQYWRNQPAAEQKGSKVDRKKELKRLAKETKNEAGVYQIRNTRNGKIFVHATPDLKTMNGQQFSLGAGSHMNRELQQEWNEFGGEAFVFEVLEVLEVPETGYFDRADELKRLKQRWLVQLQPYGERGYNSPREQK